MRGMDSRVCYGTVSSGNTGFYGYIHSIYYVLFTIRCQNYFFNVYSGKREEPFQNFAQRGRLHVWTQTVYVVKDPMNCL
jgi:hypothetical protein